MLSYEPAANAGMNRRGNSFIKCFFRSGKHIMFRAVTPADITAILQLWKIWFLHPIV